jgi:hypothetical protein
MVAILMSFNFPLVIFIPPLNTASPITSIFFPVNEPLLSRFLA